jgi:WD40 repeat protein
MGDKSRTVLGRYIHSDGPVECFSFSPTGCELLPGIEKAFELGKLSVHDEREGLLVSKSVQRPLRWQSTGISVGIQARSLVWSPDAKWFLLGEVNGNVQLFNVDGIPQFLLRDGHRAEGSLTSRLNLGSHHAKLLVHCLAHTPLREGMMFATESIDCTTRIWKYYESNYVRC